MSIPSSGAGDTEMNTTTAAERSPEESRETIIISRATLERTIRQEPLLSCVIAFGAGVVLGALATGRASHAVRPGRRRSLKRRLARALAGGITSVIADRLHDYLETRPSHRLTLHAEPGGDARQTERRRRNS